MHGPSRARCGGNVADLLGLLGRVLHNVFQQQIVGGAAGNAVEVVGAVQLRVGGLNEALHRAIGIEHRRMVDDLGGGLRLADLCALVLAGGSRDSARLHLDDLGLHAQVAHAQELPGVAAHQERRAGVIAQEGLVHGIFLHHDVHHGKREGGVGGGLHRNPHIGASSQLGHDGVDDHQLGAGLLGVGHEMPVVNLRIGDVGAPHEQRLSVLEIGGIVQHPITEVAHDAVDATSVGLVASDLDHAGVDLVEEDIVHGRRYAADGSQVSRAAGIGDGLLAVFCLDALPLVGDLLNGLFPGNALPLAGPALAYAAHGILDAVGAVNVVDMAQAPQADAINATVGKRVERALGRLDDFIVAHMNVELACTRAVAAADAAEDFLTIALGLPRLVSLGLGKAAGSESPGASRGYNSGRNARRLEKVSARESVGGTKCLSHLSSSHVLGACFPCSPLPWRCQAQTPLLSESALLYLIPFR